MTDRIREYWETRAAESAGRLNATTDDVWLRELEIETFVKTIRRLSPQARTLLAGCGDGHSTLRIADALPQLEVLGVDSSANMIALANERLRQAPSAPRVSFAVGDATNLEAACGSRLFDLVLADRRLINLETLDRQRLALEQIAGRLHPGGLYIGIENFTGGQDGMNAARAGRPASNSDPLAQSFLHRGRIQGGDAERTRVGGMERLRELVLSGDPRDLLENVPHERGHS